MEQRFFINEFEQSLKEQSDQFQMVPSKKVWHGIYNDLHPGRKWPSIAMSLSLIFTLVFISHLNTHNEHRTAPALNKIAEINATTENSNQAGTEKNNQKTIVRNNDQKNNPKTITVTKQLSNTASPNGLAINDNPQNNNLLNTSLLAVNSPRENTLNSSFSEKNSILPEHQNKNADATKITGSVYDDRQSGLQDYKGLTMVVNEPVAENVAIKNFNDQQVVITSADKNILNIEPLPQVKNINKTSANIKSSDIAKTSMKKHKKRNENISWVYYAAPVVSSVSFSGEALKLNLPNSTFSPALPLAQANPKENKVLHNSALGFEAGTQMNYIIAKKLKFTTGLQLAYSGYNIISNDVHPTSSELALRDPSTGMVYIKSYYTHYGDGTGLALTTLRNYSWQASIPVGLQYAFYEKNKLQFSFAANIEPSFVLKANSFILSSDGKNYVNDPSLLRKWNFSSNFGTFITFNSSKFQWQIGPNVRYQWLSTYQKEYIVKEHLIDYGIRIGISKNK